MVQIMYAYVLPALIGTLQPNSVYLLAPQSLKRLPMQAMVLVTASRDIHGTHLLEHAELIVLYLTIP